MSSFGLITGFGFLVSSFLLWRAAREEARDEEKIIDLMLTCVFWGAVFGRVAFIATHFNDFGTDFGRWFLFVKYPGFALFGIIAGVILVLRKNFWELGDLFSRPVTVLMVFGYFGQNKYHFAGLYFGLLLVFLLVNRKVKNYPEWRKLFEKPGMLALLFLIFTFAINLSVIAIGGVFLFLFRYNKFTKTMIKFPSQVLAGIKKYLEDRKSNVEHQLKELKKEDPFEDKTRLLDQAANDSEANQKAGHERTQVLINQMNAVLIETRKALTKIKIGNYGICDKCKKMIDTDRLAAMPTATLCVNCAKKKTK